MRSTRTRRTTKKIDYTYDGLEDDVSVLCALLLAVRLKGTGSSRTVQAV